MKDKSGALDKKPARSRGLGLPAFEIARTSARSELPPGWPTRLNRPPAPDAAAESSLDLEAALSVASMASALQSARLVDLKRHLAAQGDTATTSLLSDLERGSRLLTGHLERGLRLLQQHPRATLAGSFPETQPLAQVLAQALRSPLAQLGDLSVACDVDVEPDLATPGDPGAWSEVFSNLVANSAQHGFEGRTRGHISVVARRSGPSVLRVIYRDDGVGLSAAAREQAFRGRYTSRPADGSRGLGLCILRDIVQGQLGGAIALLETSAGAAFAIDVPARRAA